MFLTLVGSLNAIAAIIQSYAMNSIHAIVVKSNLAALHCQPAATFQSCDKPAIYIRKFLRAELHCGLMTRHLVSYIRKFLRAELHCDLVTRHLVVKSSLAALHCQPAATFQSCDKPAIYIRKFLRAELHCGLVTRHLVSYIKKFLRAELHKYTNLLELCAYRVLLC